MLYGLSRAWICLYSLELVLDFNLEASLTAVTCSSLADVMCVAVFRLYSKCCTLISRVSLSLGYTVVVHVSPSLGSTENVVY